MVALVGLKGKGMKPMGVSPKMMEIAASIPVTTSLRVVSVMKQHLRSSSGFGYLTVSCPHRVESISPALREIPAFISNILAESRAKHK